MSRRAARALAAVLICAAPAFAAAGAARAQQEELKDVERALREDRTRAEDLQRQADKLARDIQSLRVESVTAARKAQDHESRLSAMEARLAEWERQEGEKIEALAARRLQLGQTLSALQRIALQPSDALLLSPASPLDTVRSGLLLRAAIPAIEERAVALREELRVLGALRIRIAAQRGQLAETAAALTGERLRLAKLIARKSETLAAATAGQQAARQRAARLAARAADLRDLMEGVEREAADRAERETKRRAAQKQATQLAREAQKTRERDAAAGKTPETAPAPGAEASGSEPGPRLALARPPDIRPFPSSGQSLVMPARGRMKFHFGQIQGDGRAARGIVIAARKGAQVVAPYDGKVVYAGAFRTYGQILIIEHGGRYHTLLAGLERIDTVVGQWLLAGEPVGVLASPDGSGPELYLELRHAGKPINPLPWLATTGDKVRG